MHGGEALRAGATRVGRDRDGTTRPWRGGRGCRTSIPLALFFGAAVLPVDAQRPASETTRPAERRVSEEAASAELPGAGQGLFRGDDWLLGGVMLAALASSHLEAFESLDAELAPGDAPLTPHGGIGTQWHRRVPRTMGRMEVAGAAVAGTWLVGTISGSEAIRRVGRRAFEAFLVNSVVTTVVKVGVGRARPDSGHEGDDFRPGSFSSNNWSYPSGHTSTVFALATVVSAELGDEAPWVPFIAYPLAGWTGMSRVLDSRHWFTDVVAGAALGVLTGRLVSRRHATDIGARDVAIQPELVVISEGAGVGLGVRIIH